MSVKPPRHRVHWVVLAVYLIAVFAALLVHGMASHEVGAEGDFAPPDNAPHSAVPNAVFNGGPVVAVRGGVARSLYPRPRTVALTFDDGPDPVWTPQILDVLRRHHAAGTFFVIGSHAAAHPELIRRIIQEGSEVGCHTYTHANIAAIPDWRLRAEIYLTQNALGAAGIQTRLFRPPYSSVPDALDNGTWSAVERLGLQGYVSVFADHDTRDWARPGVAAILKEATPRGHAGAVVMMHDGGGDRSQTVAALDALLDELSRRGYRFETVTQAVGLPAGDPPAPPGMRERGVALDLVQTGADDLVDWLDWYLYVVGALLLLRTVLVGVLARRHARAPRRAARVDAPVSVIVPAYNEAAGIEATVRSLVDTTHPHVEVVVVDDGSTDGTAEIVEAMGLPNVTVVRQANAGKAAALNHGIAVARHDLLVLVDGDTVFEPQTIERLVAPLADPRVGAVSGNTKVGNRRHLLARWQHIEYVITFNLDRRMYDVLGCVPTVPGAIGAFRREALAGVGGISEDTLAEDTDVTMSLCRAGWRVVYEESARAWTEVPTTLRGLWRQRYRWSYGTLQAMWRHRRAVVERGASGRFGRRALPYLTLFHVLLPLTAPAVDVFAVYALLFLGPWQAAVAWLSFPVFQGVVGWYAFRLDRESPRPLLTLPLQQFAYRQLMYLVVIQSVAAALLGVRVLWNRLRRHGEAGAALAGSPEQGHPPRRPAHRAEETRVP